VTKLELSWISVFQFSWRAFPGIRSSYNEI
jgi:hypothetical protein